MAKQQITVRQQYLDIKVQYPDCILFFRMGDFYEMFDADAEIAARELDLTLTGRSWNKDKGERSPMAGVPYHAAEGYIARLIEKGYHVAVCDQLSEPNGRGIVDRDVTRVITPGTITEPSLLSENRANYLLALVPHGSVDTGEWRTAGIAYADVSTGEFQTTQLEGENVGMMVLEELGRIAPREVIIPQAWAERGVSLPNGMHLTPVADWQFEQNAAQQALMTHFGVKSLDGFGLNGLSAAIAAAGGVLQYIRKTQRDGISQITGLKTYTTANFMVLDLFTRRNLELTETIRGRSSKGSLLDVLDRTVTAMGARLLHHWVNQPLLDVNALNRRLDVIEALTQHEALRIEISDLLKTVSDIERLTNRLVIGKATPRDMLGLRQSLAVIPNLHALLDNVATLKKLAASLDPCAEVSDEIAAALNEDAPANFNSIGVIRTGYAQELDDILNASRHAREWISTLEAQERRRTGIASIKVGFNQVFGYYIEVTHANVDKVPDDYIRKQTLVNAERYITPELKEYETLVLNAEEQILAVERRLFDDLCQRLREHADRLLKTARAIAHLDAFLSLAEVAVREGYVRPTLTDDDRLIITGGRHPVVEKLLSQDTRYVPNDTHFDSMSRVHLITGPNMSGKSTYIRQVAIITLMAQIGSFVPAHEAIIGVVDRIFARIGAQDEIHAGQSTFMVEMVETARLLSGSTRRSLLILDEVGRGTSTYDGLAIARAVVEYIHNNPRLNCRTLFATHYHELTELPNILPRTRNYNVAVAEDHETIVFLHKVVAGGADRSYGVHVAQLAGMPRPVVDRARQLLQDLEAQASDFRLPSLPNARPTQLSLFDAPANPAVKLLKALNVDELSPLEALTKLYELKRLVEND